MTSIQQAKERVKAWSSGTESLRKVYGVSHPDPTTSLQADLSTLLARVEELEGSARDLRSNADAATPSVGRSGKYKALPVEDLAALLDATAEVSDGRSHHSTALNLSQAATRLREQEAEIADWKAWAKSKEEELQARFDGFSAALAAKEAEIDGLKERLMVVTNFHGHPGQYEDADRSDEVQDAPSYREGWRDAVYAILDRIGPEASESAPPLSALPSREEVATFIEPFAELARYADDDGSEPPNYIWLSDTGALRLHQIGERFGPKDCIKARAILSLFPPHRVNGNKDLVPPGNAVKASAATPSEKTADKYKALPDDQEGAA